MKNLAIYGDSFACCHRGHEAEPLLTSQGWPNLLISENLSVTNYAYRGTSLFYTYQKFVATHDQHDQCLVIVTWPGRYTQRIDSRPRGLPIYAPTLDNCDAVIASDDLYHLLTPLERQRVELLKDYYIHLQDWSYEQQMHRLMLADIRKIRPDAILVPGSPMSQVDNEPLTLLNYVKLQARSLWPDRTERADNPQTVRGRIEELRCICHFTPEINQLVAKDMLASLSAGRYLQSDLPQQIAHARPAEDYIRVHDQHYQEPGGSYQ